MTEIHSMAQGHKYWEETMALAERCSWKAGPFLARKMRENDFEAWERVFAARVDGMRGGHSARWPARTSCPKGTRSRRSSASSLSARRIAGGGCRRR